MIVKEHMEEIVDKIGDVLWKLQNIYYLLYQS
jgi:uncharacterized protein YlzI (FlbEa/FlbD family)